MDKIEYLQDLYNRVYTQNLHLIPKLHNANYNQQHTVTIDELFELDRILSSEIAKKHFESLDEFTDDDILNKLILKLERDIEKLERISQGINTIRNFELN